MISSLITKSNYLVTYQIKLILQKVEKMTKTIEMFKKLALTTKDFQKQQMILDLLKDFNPVYIEGTGIFISGGKKVIVSHYDLVRPFEAGFAEGRTIVVDGEIVTGALDNTITNAILINELLEHGLPEDTSILFTDGEETGLTGMSNFMSNLKKKKKYFFINLDVTDDNFNKAASIEYDFPNVDICKEIDTFSGIDAGFTDVRFTDDLSAVLYYGGHGFSFCIPTREYCHTYMSNTTITHIEEYVKGLHYLIQDFKLPKDISPTNKYGVIKQKIKG